MSDLLTHSHSLGHWHGYFYESGGVRETVGTDSMMTLVLEPPERERDFKANGWSIRGRFTVTGSWSIDENGLMQIKFKMSFPFRIRYVVPIFFNGHFDPIHNALTGIWGYSAEVENTMGLLELRRIPPCYLAVYPSIKELSDNRSRALWRFAIAAVRNDIRQRRCPWSYFAQRRDDRETVVSLAVRSQLFGKPLDGEEAETLCAAAQRLTPADACFYGSMICRQRASTLTHE
jgi:Vacuolar sorting-associated protein 13, N-terminal